MRIKFFRILPEICASTWCLFSSSTRNIAFGSGSITVAITSMASSFGFSESFFFSCPGLFLMSCCPASPLPARPFRFPRPRQNPRPVLRHRHRVLEMCRGASVGRHRRPLVFQHPHLGASAVHHRLDRQHHSLLPPRAVARLTLIRELRLFVHPRPDPVPHELPHHRKPVSFHPSLHRRRDVAQPVSQPRLFDSLVQRLPRHPQQPCPLRVNRSHRQRLRRVRVVPVALHPEVHREDVSRAQLPRRRRYPVHHFLVDRRAQRRRVSQISLERWPRPALPAEPFRELVQLLRAHSGPHHLLHRRQRLPDHQPRPVHLLHFARRLAHDHRFAEPARIPSSARVTSSTPPSPSSSLSAPWLR